MGAVGVWTYSSLHADHEHHHHVRTIYAYSKSRRYAHAVRVPLLVPTRVYSVSTHPLLNNALQILLVPLVSHSSRSTACKLAVLTMNMTDRPDPRFDHTCCRIYSAVWPLTIIAAWRLADTVRAGIAEGGGHHSENTKQRRPRTATQYIALTSINLTPAIRCRLYPEEACLSSF